MKKMQSGFTLIELIMVIVILGALAAVALPRYADLAGDARVASVNGINGAIAAASAIAHAQGLVSGVTDGTITLEGQNVTLVNGYPSTATIADALATAEGFAESPAGTFLLDPDGDNTGITNCGVTYAQPANAGETPTITVITTGC